jgi:glycosyltransferase involved in cell wall biosynthesis
MKLSILILSITSRAEVLKRLLNELEIQIELYNLNDSVEIITEIDNGEKTIGEKRNIAKAKAKGEYICFIDDDDMVSRDYLKRIIEKINNGYDLVTFYVDYIRDGQKNGIICPSPTLDGIKAGEIMFWNNMLHLCPHKKSISDNLIFPHRNTWEDLEYSRELCKLNLKEFRIENILYFYHYNSLK